jgi:hypothetical protein
VCVVVRCGESWALSSSWSGVVELVGSRRRRGGGPAWCWAVGVVPVVGVVVVRRHRRGGALWPWWPWWWRSHVVVVAGVVAAVMVGVVFVVDVTVAPALEAAVMYSRRPHAGVDGGQVAAHATPSLLTQS